MTKTRYGIFRSGLFSELTKRRPRDSMGHFLSLDSRATRALDRIKKTHYQKDKKQFKNVFKQLHPANRASNAHWISVN